MIILSQWHRSWQWSTAIDGNYPLLFTSIDKLTSHWLLDTCQWLYIHCLSPVCTTPWLLLWFVYSLTAMHVGFCNPVMSLQGCCIQPLRLDPGQRSLATCCYGTNFPDDSSRGSANSSSDEDRVHWVLSLNGPKKKSSIHNTNRVDVSLVWICRWDR